MIWVAVIVGALTAPTAWGLDHALSLRARRALGALIAAASGFISAGIVGPPIALALPACLAAAALAATTNQALSVPVEFFTERKTMTNPYPSRAEAAREVVLVPPETQLAAKRGFLRTTVQAYAATIPAGGVSAGALLTLVQSPDPAVLICTAVAALVSPLLAGAASYLSIMGSGIPQAYTGTILAEQG